MAGAQVQYASALAKQLTEDYLAKLGAAQSIRVQFSEQWVGKGRSEFDAILVRPNIGVIKTPGQWIYLDGTTITVYNPGRGQYMTTPETPRGIRHVFNRDVLLVLRPFFDAGAFHAFYSIDSGGLEVRNGVELQKVVYNEDAKGERQLTLYLDPQDDLFREAELRRGYLKVDGSLQTRTMVLIVHNLTLNPPLQPSDTTFSPAAAAQVPWNLNW